MVLSAQTIKELGLIKPCIVSQRDVLGNSFGLSACGYDITLAHDVELASGEFLLVGALEYFNLPDNIVGIVHDKSSLARKGLAVQNTVLEPGWRGYLTLELSNHAHVPGHRRLLNWITKKKDVKTTLRFKKGCAIAQVIFHFLDKPTAIPYSGKYQDQEIGPQEARV
jgi:dCTP deaminase